MGSSPAGRPVFAYRIECWRLPSWIQRLAHFTQKALGDGLSTTTTRADSHTGTLTNPTSVSSGDGAGRSALRWPGIIRAKGDRNVPLGPERPNLDSARPGPRPADRLPPPPVTLLGLLDIPGRELPVELPGP